ncbi:MAG: polysaccharide export protein [Pseudomonadales bacterium]|nr:polysaccharide export protein [Pseudomonadales bacterium]
MRYLVVTKTLRCLMMFSLMGFSQSIWADAPNTDYLLQSGDIIEVSVWKEPDLQRELLISPSGKISFPLIGHLRAEGNSIEKLNQVIAEELAAYIPDPSVTVMLKSTAGNRFFVIGKVNRPGQYPMAQATTVLQALSIAGGTTTYANTSDIKVIRHDAEQSAISFSYDDIKEGKSLSKNVRLLNGDVVVVP